MSSIHGESLTRFMATGDYNAPDAGGTRLFAIRGSLLGANFPLAEGETSLGRRTDNGIILSEPGISKRHCVFVREGSGACFVSDAGSKNGTEVNGRLLKEGQRLQLTHGDTIRICDTALLFVQPARADADAAGPSLAVDRGRAAREAEEFLAQAQDVVRLRRLRRG